MKSTALALLMFPLAASAGPFHQRLLDVVGALEEGRASVRKTAPGCRDGMLPNFEAALRDLEDARRHPSVLRVQQVQLFVAGMTLAGTLAGCPSGLMATLARARAGLAALAATRDDVVLIEPDLVESTRSRSAPAPRSGR
jgi:hypothetical protein